MATGDLKRVDQVRRGDSVQSRSGPATVLCVVRTQCKDGKASLVTLNGLEITPWHPCSLDGGRSWHFPCDLCTAVQTTCPAVYSFVLQSGHTMLINGVQCVTLGHGLKGAVVGHGYFGTSKVIQDLKAMKGWETGYIDMVHGCLMTRDPANGHVTRMRPLTAHISTILVET